MSRRWKNRDYLKRLNYPRQTYAFSGIDFGDTTSGAERQKQKLVIQGAPMFVSPMPPGSLGRGDELWQQVYGASVDSIMSIFDGSQLFVNIQTANNLGFPYNDGTFNAKNSNLYEKLGGRQQIQYITSKSTIKEARESVDAGDVQEMRSLCLRGPIHIAGWGRTITQRPTDPEPENPRDNDDEHKLDRSTWKVGPLDIRWDEDRACWRAFNDLIADDEGKNLGTWVHSTNPDLSCGFPFLRGKLEDVWSVRKTVPGAGLGKDNDSEKSGTVCTKIDSLLFQDLDDLTAPFSDVFIVFDECTNGTPAVCGAETTTPATLGILTASSFFFNENYTGPLGFTIVPPDNVELGHMYYEGDGPCGVWRPGIEVDICKIGGTELGVLVSNDLSIQSATTKALQGVSYNQSFIKPLITFDSRTANSEIEFAEDSVKAGFEKIEAWSDNVQADINVEIQKAVFNAYQQLATNTQIALNLMYDDLIGKINDCCQQIELQLSESCSCEIEIPIIEGVPPQIQFGALGLPFVNRDLGLEPEIAAADEFISDTTNREADIEALEQVFDEDPPSPVTSSVSDPCSSATPPTTETVEIRGT